MFFKVILVLMDWFLCNLKLEIDFFVLVIIGFWLVSNVNFLIVWLSNLELDIVLLIFMLIIIFFNFGICIIEL